MKQNLTYRDAGVDIDSGNALVERIKPLARATRRDGVLGNLGGFGALFELPVEKYRRPVLVSGTDGVGTKLRFAIERDSLDGLGIDLVAICVNDIAVTGAEALYFLDYYATSTLDIDTAERVVAGIAKGCELAGCALSGGETAEMPGIYQPGDFDIAGFAVGIVEKDEIIDGSKIESGDLIIGLSSSGVHSNGFSMINHIHSTLKNTAGTEGLPPDIAERLLEPTRIYCRALNALTQSTDIKGMAHITGGGLSENLPRIIPPHLSAHIDTSSWTRATEFQWIRENGNVTASEMYRVFNCGIGMAIIVAPGDSDNVLASLESSGESASVIGEIGHQPSTVDAERVTLENLEKF